MKNKPSRPEDTEQTDLPTREPYVPPIVEDIDTTYGPAETSAGVPVGSHTF